MKMNEYFPTSSPTLTEQQDALQKGLGRAVQWARSGRLADKPLLDACLHDKRFDAQCEDNRGDWLWGILNVVGSVQRFREPILGAFRSVTTEKYAYQLCQLALHYAEMGDNDFKAGLYEFVERKPVPECPWIGEGQLLALDGKEAFRFIARIRGNLLESHEWDWDSEALVDRAIEGLGEQQAQSLLDEPGDSGISRFATAWRENRRSTGEKLPSHVEEMRAITVNDILEAVNGKDKCYWLRGWGMHANEADVREVLPHLWTAHDPTVIAKLLRVFGGRTLPEFDPRLIELCQHTDPDVRRSAFNAVECNAHPLVRAFALAEIQKGVRSAQVVSLFIKNYEQGDEERVAEALELPEDENELHWLLMDVVKMLEKNHAADCSQLGLVAYALTPCELCRFSAVRLLYVRNVAPKWLIEECRYDSNEECRELWQKASGSTEANVE